MVPLCCPVCRREFTAAEAQPFRLLNDILDLVPKIPQMFESAANRSQIQGCTDQKTECCLKSVTEKVPPSRCPICEREFTAADVQPFRLLDEILELVQKIQKVDTSEGGHGTVYLIQMGRSEGLTINSTNLLDRGLRMEYEDRIGPTPNLDEFYRT
ncbi:unnamed protein product [Dibothriocephalus latus]|uniref:Uncharacterized protein n=1 Tax=Dibothriocephalus latus TaxID=60516 RepID=A0A3P7L525_DIBLA|nr:unnamed protein product [Dibothriocephalus latus]